MEISRNVKIDIKHESEESVDPNNNANDTNSYCEKIISGYYGEIIVGWVVGLLINKNLLTGRNIAPTEVKFAKNANLEDEIEFKKEGKITPPETVSREK